MNIDRLAASVLRTVLALSFCMACCACGLSTLAIIPTLFAKQSRLEGCPNSFQLPNAVLELTFVTVTDDGSTEAADGEIIWSIRDGTADVDESGNNPVVVTLTTIGVVTIRGDYNPSDENVNPAICTIFVQTE